MREKLFAMESHSFETSSGGNSIWSVETDPGCVSTSTFMNGVTVAALDGRRIKFHSPATGEAGLARKRNGFAGNQTNTRSRDNLRSRRSKSWQAFPVRVNQSRRRDSNCRLH